LEPGNSGASVPSLFLGTTKGHLFPNFKVPLCRIQIGSLKARAQMLLKPMQAPLATMMRSRQERKRAHSVQIAVQESARHPRVMADPRDSTLACAWPGPCLQNAANTEVEQISGLGNRSFALLLIRSLLISALLKRAIERLFAHSLFCKERHKEQSLFAEERLSNARSL